MARKPGGYCVKHSPLVEDGVVGPVRGQGGPGHINDEYQQPERHGGRGMPTKRLRAGSFPGLFGVLTSVANPLPLESVFAQNQAYVVAIRQPLSAIRRLRTI